jgi:hypothetical protein
VGSAVTEIALYTEAPKDTTHRIVHVGTVFWGRNTWFVVDLIGMMFLDLGGLVSQIGSGGIEVVLSDDGAHEINT